MIDSSSYTLSKKSLNILKNCILCPRECGVNRLHGETGFCRAGIDIEIASATLHFGEEPVISGDRGSGTIFFSHCNARCIYCQNFPISQLGYGRQFSNEEFGEMLFELQARGAENINLVTPVPQLPLIRDIIIEAKDHGLEIPVVMNMFGWGNDILFDFIKDMTDVFLIDSRYSDDQLGKELSGVENYSKQNISFIKKILKNYNHVKFNEKRIMTRGVIIRHLVLPGYVDNSIRVLENLKENFGPEIYISIMNQYFPAFKAQEHHKLNRRISKQEWERVLETVEKLGFLNGYIQEFYE